MTSFLRKIALLILLACVSTIAWSASIWDEFLLKPNSKNSKALEASMLASSQHCDQDVWPTEKQTMALLKLIQNGNPSAYRLVSLASQCLGVSDLEDLYRSAGAFFEVQPRAFLKLIKEESIPERDLRYMLTMLPLTTTDNIDAKLSSVENRIAILKSIHDSSINDSKFKALFILDKEIINLTKIKEDMGTK